MLVLEGTYPFNGGGVSTWAHILCNEVQNVDFTLYSINAAFEEKPKFELSKNIKAVIQVPLWTPDEPKDYMNYGEKYYKTILKKEFITEAVVKQKFIPIFHELLHFIYSENLDMKELDRIFYEFWLYFEDYDYKETMRSQAVWEAYCEVIKSYIIMDSNPETSLLDLTIGMRWIYRFLIPLSITNVPKVDIVHLTLSGFPLIPALIASYKYGSKIILTEHGVFIRERLLAINNSEYPFFLKNLLIKFSESIARLTYHKANSIISVNQFNKRWETLYGADPSKISVIYNGIDEKLFCPREKPEHLKNIPTVVGAARIFELKDILTMIRSCVVVKKIIPNVQYLVYGDEQADPEYTQECLALIAELGLTDNFKLLGNSDHAHDIFAEGDVSILTSISEGFPYTVLESMSCAVPVVATDVGGVSEALTEDTGFLCKPKNAEQIGQCVLLLLQDEGLRKSMGENARNRVLQNFTIHKFITKYEAIYAIDKPQKMKRLPKRIFENQV